MVAIVSSELNTQYTETSRVTAPVSSPEKQIFAAGTQTNNTSNTNETQDIKTSKKSELIKLCADNKIDLKALYGISVESLNDEALCEELIKKVNNLINHPSKLQVLNKLLQECAELGKSASEIFAMDIETASEKQIKTMLDAIEAAKKYAETKKLNVNSQEYKDLVIEQSKINNVGLNSGWSKETLAKKSLKGGESLEARLQRTFPMYFDGGKTLATMSDSERKEVLEKYFNGFFTEKIKKGMPKDKAAKLQLQDFSKLLINTSDEDKVYLKEAISSLMSENRLQGVFATQASFDSLEAQMAWNDSWTPEDLAYLVKHKDAEGNNLVGSKDAEEAFITIKKGQSEGALKKGIESLDKKLQIINKKIANGEALTQEEQDILDTKGLQYSSNVVAIGANNNIKDNESRDELLKNNDDSMVKNLSKEEYIETINQAKEYIEAHPEVLSMPKEEFFSKLDNVTEGRFSLIADGKGESIELHKPTEYASNITTKNNDFGFTTNPIADDKKLKQLTDEVAATEEKQGVFEIEYPQDNTITINKNRQIVSNVISFTKYINSNGIYQGMRLIGDNFADASSILKSSYIIYLKQHKEDLYNILYNASSAAKEAAIEAGLVDEELGKNIGLTSDKMTKIKTIEEKKTK